MFKNDMVQLDYDFSFEDFSRFILIIFNDFVTILFVKHPYSFGK